MHQHVTRSYDSICLIVEDSAFDQRRMTRIMRQSFRNVRIDVASTLAEARRHLQRHQTSLILLDNNLPDGKGANFAMELAQDPTMARIPIVMVSDWPSPFMWEKAHSAGVRHIVDKSEFGPAIVQSALVSKQRTQDAG
ncbi:response regulator [Sulfitobacter sabulilitoris]|uniref:Response regulator n=1 Tax=Sulfitobacter sabulilitoris TaxID=2562655 RepID=A0A5S3PEE3_9RHOB|nr:response regulator [Sulfitobacter sabulilitoris]TMM52414.1 response regulator [Sulfitobacter sabulilitoris]